MSYRVLDFELQADPDGEWIPMAVRMKLDLVGLKIGLDDWQALAIERRDELLVAPAETEADLVEFELLLRRLLSAGGKAAPRSLGTEKRARVDVWKDPSPLPASVATVFESIDRAGQWPRLDRFGRYLVVKLVCKDDPVHLAAALDDYLGDRPASE